MLKKILIGVAAVIVVLVVVIATRPSAFHVERSITIAAPADAAYAQVSDFHKWAAWSPWEKLDPGMKKIFDGEASGKGAIYAWEGNDKVGEGRMTITAATPPSRIDIKLEFLKPFAATNATTFAFTAGGQETKVVWSMDGTNNFAAKAASLFMDMDKMVGGDFERGLAQLKVVAEAAKPKVDPASATAK